MATTTEFLVEGCTFAELTRTRGFAICVKEYAECAPVPGAGINYELYEQLSRLGKLEVFRLIKRAHTESEKPWDYLVGFMGLVLTKSSHYPQGILTTDSLFIRKNYRKYGGFERLLGAAKNAARGMGLPGFTLQAPRGSALDRILQHQGPELYHIFWMQA